MLNNTTDDTQQCLPLQGITIHSQTRRLQLGSVAVGGGAPVAVQSMCSTDTRDVAATLEQLQRLARAGCEIARVAVPDAAAAAALPKLCAAAPLPLVADIHYDYRLALQAVDAGVAGLRLNPGNIGPRWKVQEVVRACQPRRLPIRIGVNGGSLDAQLVARYGGPTPAAMVASAQQHLRLLEECGYDQAKVSLKFSDVPRTLQACRLFAEQEAYPQHLGITEAGTCWAGSLKSAVGIGALLAAGIGDTLRVSLTADPVEEVRVAWQLLQALELRQRGPVLVSCPSCGRCEIDLIATAEAVEAGLAEIEAPLTVAVMGCSVNGPGEAKEANVGLAGGKGTALLFRHGEVLRRVPGEDMVAALLAEVQELAAAWQQGAAGSREV